MKKKRVFYLKDASLLPKFRKWVYKQYKSTQKREVRKLDIGYKRM